jgi:diguanylate cyclase (GGDEF)-like protein/PAS domain S-box-containing protein
MFDLSLYRFDGASVAYFLAALVMFVVAAIMARRWNVPGAPALVCLELAAAAWALPDVFELAATTVPLKVFWSVVAYPGIAAAPVCFYLAARTFGYHRRRLSAKHVIAVSLFPAATVLVAATNFFHNLLWSWVVIDVSTNIATYGRGPWFSLFVVYSYGLVFLGIVRFVSVLRALPAAYRGQLVTILAGSLFALLGSVFYLFRFSQRDWTPLGMALAGLCLFLGMTRYRMLDLLPIARNLLVETMDDGVLVTDTHGRIIDMNPAMKELLGVRERRAVLMGTSARELLTEWEEILPLLDGSEPLRLEIACVGADGNTRYLDVRRRPLPGRNGEVPGILFLLGDVTKRHVAEERLREMACRDSLTGAYTMRYMEELLQKGIERHLREGFVFSVAFLDLDHFKRINDTYGHPAGDAVLRGLVELFEVHLGPEDVVGRFGGEEFILLFPGRGLRASVCRTLRLLARTRHIPFPWGNESLRVSFSAGVASVEEESLRGALSKDLLIALADRRLYEAKRRGRCCVVAG